jgi:hypothetical protein
VHPGTTFTRSPGISHTERLMRKSMAIMEGQGASAKYLRAVDHENQSAKWEQGERFGHPDG